MKILQFFIISYPKKCFIEERKFKHFRIETLLIYQPRIQYSPAAQCHYYKANLLKQRQLSTFETICQLINLFLSFTFQEMKQIDLFTVRRFAFLFSCLPLLFSACLFLRPCETFMNTSFYKSAGKSATSSATSTAFWKSSSNL